MLNKIWFFLFPLFQWKRCRRYISKIKKPKHIYIAGKVHEEKKQFLKRFFSGTQLYFQDTVDILKVSTSIDAIFFFSAGKSASELEKEIQGLLKKLHPEGFFMLITPGSVGSKLLSFLDSQLGLYTGWNNPREHILAYRPFGNGRVGDPLPKDYKYYRQSQDLLSGECSTAFKPTIIGKPGCIGVRWKVGPVYFELFSSDIEPEIEPFPHFRYITWEPVTRAEKPKGWKWSRLTMLVRKTGYCQLNGDREYWKKWDSHAQRHRKKWLEKDSQNYEIDTASLEEFIQSYNNTKKLPFLRGAFISVLKRRYERNKKDLHLFVVREKASKKIVAGLATLDLMDIRASQHVIAFFHKSVAHTSVNVGLIDNWYQHALKKNIRCLNFGIFWHPGDPKSFKGFSHFKRQFNIRYIVYPKPFFRSIRANRMPLEKK